MALSAVRLMTLAFVRGDATAEDVVRLVELPRKRNISVEETIRQTNEDFTQDVPENTWSDVDRYWSMLDETQQDQLTAARKRKFGA